MELKDFSFITYSVTEYDPTLTRIFAHLWNLSQFYLFIFMIVLVVHLAWQV